MRNNIWLVEIPSTTWSDFVLHGIIILLECWTRDWGLSPPLLL